MDYTVWMPARPATRSKRRRTTMVPVTTMEEIPVLSAAERAALAAALKRAEDEIKAGKGSDFQPAALRKRLLGIYRRGKRS